MMDMRCPRCRNPHTLKATSVINSGNTMSATTGGAVAMGFGGPMVGSYASTTHVQSMLAGKLRPPLPPRKASPAAAIALMVVSIALGLGSISCGLGESADPSDPQAYQTITTFIHATEIIAGVFLAVVIACIIWIIATAPRRKAVYMNHLAHWQRAMYNWDQLYYCNICDSVYLQTTRQFTSLDTMYGLLFSV